jgi:polynucleotide 5'-kinase involved in rRNA processing
MNLRREKRDDLIYDTLVKGLSFPQDVPQDIDETLPREALVQEMENLISLSAKSRGYSLVIGEHGTGKTTLIERAIGELSMSKGVIHDGE